MARETKEMSLAVRVSSDLLASLDEYARVLEAQAPGLNVSRSDAVRYLLSVALQLRETQGVGLLDRVPQAPTPAAAPTPDDGKLIRLTDNVAPRAAGGLAAS